jgi:hypothetical protein
VKADEAGGAGDQNRHVDRQVFPRQVRGG